MIKMDGGKIDPRGEGEKHASRHQPPTNTNELSLRYSRILAGGAMTSIMNDE